MKKIFIIILASIFIIAIFYVLNSKIEKDPKIPEITKTQPNFQEYQEYINYPYGYSFNYPKEVLIKNYSETNVNINLNQFNNKDSLMFNINVYLDNNINGSIQDWWREHESPENNRQAPYPDEEKIIKIAGEDAYYTVYDSESNAFGYEKLAAVFIYVGHNGKVYEISGGKLPANPSERGLTQDDIKTIRDYEKTFNQILESFKFTN